MYSSRRKFLVQSAAAAITLPALPRSAVALLLHPSAPPSPTVVSTPSGSLRGEARNRIKVFRGIPFAEPPVGPLRFRPTVPVRPWSGVRDALTPAPMAVQNNSHAPYSEDCLYLNLWAPDGPGPYPVLVWIHGGGFTGGSASDPMTDGARFANSGIVCITVAYRLGVFGFLDVEPLLGSAYSGSANNALHDLVTALAWVQSHVAAFGGDPARVTVGGQSAGAKLTDILLGVPAAQPLFASAISESGGAERVWSRQQAVAISESFGQQWRQHAGETNAALTRAPASALLAAQNKFLDAWPQHFPLRPQVDFQIGPQFDAKLDGILLPQLPIAAIRAGSARGKRLLIGTNRDESAFFLGPSPGPEPTSADLGNLPLKAFEPVLARYQSVYPDLSPSQRTIRAVTAEEYWIPSVRVADAAAEAGCATWMYRFDYSETVGRLRSYAFHSLDVRFVWDQPDLLSLDATVEAVLAQQMHAAWIAFLEGKPPAAAGLPDWIRYGLSTRPTMILNTASHLESQPNAPELLLWKGIL